MTWAKVWLLDVGHGNSAVLQDSDGVVVIDTASRGTLCDFLRTNGITELDEVLISHADADHVGGLLNLLTSGIFKIKAIYINPDPIRETLQWADLRVALAVARQSGTTRLKTALTTELPGSLQRTNTRLRVLGPVPELALGGPGSRYRGKVVTANTLSAVIRIEFGDAPEVLLTGDLDSNGLEAVLGQGPLRAKVLVFPHHGGGTRAASPFEFARRLCDAVRPELIVFSIGRTRLQHPDPEIIRGIRSVVPSAHIACTQLAMRCADSLPTKTPGHLGPRFALGRSAHVCCAGTVEIILPSGRLEPTVSAHLNFVKENAPTALCQDYPPPSSSVRAKPVPGTVE
jgi:competence protein ComEC